MTALCIPQGQKLTPMMVQWTQCKELAKEAVLLFRMGDFYEAFHEDAVVLSKELDLTLTKRQGTPMAGIPWHSSENYIDRLVGKGYRVAVAEQTEDPKQAKGLVKREIVRVVTPGTLVQSSLLKENCNNYFASLSRVGKVYGLAFLDLSTADFRVMEFEEEEKLLTELHRIAPTEILVSKRFEEDSHRILQELKLSLKFLLNSQDNWVFSHDNSYGRLIRHFRVQSLDGFGLKGMVGAINSAGALLQFLEEQYRFPLTHIQKIQVHKTQGLMSVDRITQKNLELTESLQGGRSNTLLEVLDQTQTAMGARLLRSWVKAPLLSLERIQQRLEGVRLLLQNRQLAANLADHLSRVRDLERLMTKISAGYANARDLLGLRLSLEEIPGVKDCLHTLPHSHLGKFGESLNPQETVRGLIQRCISDDPPAKLGDGQSIREGFNEDLDEYRRLKKSGKDWLVDYQNRLRDELQIKTLKVSFTKAFGYYIDVSKSQANKVPDTFIRRQTLVNSERFISPELKEYEGKVLHAEERLASLEAELFNLLREEVSQHAQEIVGLAQRLAAIDCLLSFAEVARDRNFVEPEVTEDDCLEIEGGRHPVIESLSLGESFIPNDCLFEKETQRLFLITGPNMAGKSTFIRQVALITMMAQMGSFVPAKRAKIGLVDKVFTRIGASDDLGRGQSTFMVEMTETANILNNATERSLVILDEIGRGTSTYDGISIAQAVAEFFLKQAGQQAKTLFATHYWELTQLADEFPRAANLHVAVQESQGKITFLRKILPGCTDKSYGIHVARLAGLPQGVLYRAGQILKELEGGTDKSPAKTQKKNFAPSSLQGELFPVEADVDPLAAKLKEKIELLDPNQLTPIEALQKLVDLKSLIKTL